MKAFFLVLSVFMPGDSPVLAVHEFSRPLTEAQCAAEAKQWEAKAGTFKAQCVGPVIQ